MLPSSARGPRGRLATSARRAVAALSITVGCALGASAMTAAPGCSEEAPKPAAGEPIVVGVSLGLTNSLAGTSAPLRDAIRVAEGQINANGGVLGRPLLFDIQDDKSDADEAARVAQAFADKKVIAVIGPIGSGQVVKAHEIYAKANIVEISPTATSVDLTTIQPVEDRWFFRTTPADDFQGAAVVRFAQLTPRGLGDAGAPSGDGGVITKCTKLVIVNIDNAYGNSMADVIEKNYPKVNGGKGITLREKIPEKLASGYEDVVKRIIGAAPECMAIIAYEDTGAALITELKQNAGYAPLEQKGFFIIGTDGIFTDGFLTESRQDKSNPKSKNFAVDVYGVNPDTQPGTKEYNEFKTIFASAFPLGAGVDAPAFAANAYDAAVLIALAIQRAGALTDRPKIRDSLREVSSKPGTPFTPAQLGLALMAAKDGQDIDYKGASGAVDMEPNGNVKSGFIVWRAVRQPDDTVTYRTEGRFTLEELLGQF